MRRCLVCRRPLKTARFLCDPCGQSYDRAIAKDSTTAAIIRWAAKRAIRFARERER